MRLAWVGLAGIGVFVAGYVVAAWLYPGGTRFDHSTVGFSVVHNYWCDLLDDTAYCGRANPGRPVALAAMGFLCCGLSALWWAAPTLFPEARYRGLVVRVSGTACALVTPLLATERHDVAIDLAGLLALVAFIATMSGLWPRTSVSLRAVAAITVAVALGNYAIWRTGVGLGCLAAAQKLAFALFLTWACMLAQQILRRGSPRALRRPGSVGRE